MRVLLLPVALLLLVPAADAKLPAPPEEVAVVETGRAPCGLAAYGGELWVGVVTDKERSLVHRVDPASGNVFDAFTAGPGALAQARFGGSVWISSFAGSDVRRYAP